MNPECGSRCFLTLLAAVALTTPGMAQDADKQFRPPQAVDRTPVVQATDDKQPDKKPEDADSEASTAKSVPAKPAGDPELLRLFLVDGSLIFGKLSISQITVETEFGKLTIPVIQIRNFVPGLDSQPKLNNRLRQLIENLGGSETGQRDIAQQELLKMGPSIRSQLRQQRDDSNAEQVKRITLILAAIQEQAEDAEDNSTPDWIAEDRIETSEFTVVGKISPQSFTLKNKYGTLSIKLADIKRLQRQDAKRSVAVYKSLRVTGANLAQLQYKSSGIRVEKGDWITVRATGQISRQGSSSYVSGPDGNSSRFSFHSQNPQIFGGTLIATIGNSSKPIKVGSSRKFKALRSGLLKFAIGMRPDYAGRYQFPGQYDLKIKVDPGE